MNRLIPDDTRSDCGDGAPAEPAPNKRRKTGLVIVNTGDGKGKSTAAFGIAIRARGRGKRAVKHPFDDQGIRAQPGIEF